MLTGKLLKQFKKTLKFFNLIQYNESPIFTDTENTKQIGLVLYTNHFYLFQLSGLILLVAMIGAIVLTFRDRLGVKKQSYFKQISREKKDGVEMVDPESNKGV